MKRGISMITLIITIIVIIILAGAVIISLNNTNIISNANKAILLDKLAGYKDSLLLYHQDKALENHGYNSKELQLDSKEILDIIPGIEEKDANKFAVVNGELAYRPSSEEEEKELQGVVTVLPNKIDKVKEGNYISIPGNGKWIILNKNEKGIEVISEDIVKKVTLGGKEDYANLIFKLNEEAELYAKTHMLNYYKSARCVGSNPDNPSSYAKIPMEEIKEGVWGNEENLVQQHYKMDLEKLEKLKAANIGKKYWVAARIVTFSTAKDCAFGSKYYSNNKGTKNLYILRNGTEKVVTNELGIRPCIYLHNDVKVTEGVGSIDNPYRVYRENIGNKEYKVKFDLNGGNKGPNSEVKVHGTALEISKEIPTKTNYAFCEWNTQSDGKGQGFAPGEVYIGNNDLTLYAIWMKKEPLINRLKEGDYVKIPGTLCDWTVINKNEKGVEVISLSTVKSLKLKGLQDYKSLIDRLNNEARLYMKTNMNKYAISSRCVGSNPNNPDEYGTISYKDEGFDFNTVSPELKKVLQQEGYKIDLEKLNKLNLANIGKSYFLATRNFMKIWGDNIFYVNIIDEEGEFVNHCFFGMLYGIEQENNKSIFEFEKEEGLRPCVYLNPNILVVQGSGNELNPYVLE